MTATKQFIEDAIKGGWGSHLDKEWRVSAGYVEHMQIYWSKGVWERVIAVSTVLLDPLAWQAVGKTRGWENGYPDRIYEAFDTFFYQLYNGDSIEEALEKISN